jgi:NADP-dependent 3-hydroxy acid dehydrogenase YdfG
MDQPVSIVTGAGSGIGRATAIMLAERGHRVTLVGRTALALEETAALIRERVPSATLFPCVADVCDLDLAAMVVDRTHAACWRTRST